MFIEGKVVVITGISKGIGRALAELLLTKGSKVVGWGISVPDFTHKNLLFVKCDVRDERMVNNAARFTLETLGQVDFLVNNAGVGRFHPIEKFPTSDWQQMYEVNVQGAFFVTRALVPDMQAREAGHVINISSIAGRVGAPRGEGYNASKFALTGFSESLFHDLRKQGIKVTTVFPGSTNTDFFDEIAGFEANQNMLNPKDLAASIVHLMDTPPNYCIREIEIRPLNSKPTQD